MKLLVLALAPGLALLLFVYIKDKYEREPLKMVFKAFVSGIVAAAFLVFVYLLGNFFSQEQVGINSQLGDALYKSFVRAAIPEEFVKFLAFMLVIYKAADFNEWFDGIVYASAISLGFATLENIFYVLNSGITVGWLRAVFSVPAHFMMGVTQGFFFSLAKFGSKKLFNILLALISAIIVHGVYDFMIMYKDFKLWFLFLLYFAAIIFLSKKIIKRHLESSQFKSQEHD